MRFSFWENLKTNPKTKIVMSRATGWATGMPLGCHWGTTWWPLGGPLGLCVSLCTTHREKPLSCRCYCLKAYLDIGRILCLPCENTDKRSNTMPTRGMINTQNIQKMQREIGICDARQTCKHTTYNNFKVCLTKKKGLPHKEIVCPSDTFLCARLVSRPARQRKCMA